MTTPKDQWTSKLGVVLAVSGSAVGLGNFLRFPGQAAANGGGAFLVPYFLGLILLGIPICWAEWAMGRYGGARGFHSAPAILGEVARSRAARYVGVLGVLIPLSVSFYYTFIASWCLGYFVAYLTGSMPLDASMSIPDQVQSSTKFYQGFVGAGGNGLIFGNGSVPTVVYWGIAFGLNIYLVARGLSAGIEKFVRLAMPTIALCAVVVLIRVLTLGTPDSDFPDRNVLAGLAYMWEPDFAALRNPQTWLAATGQVFFSISVGFGVIINYASYVRSDDDIALAGLTAAATNEVFEVGFGGMITLVASVAFLGLSGTIAAVATGQFGLGFQTLPVVFAQMGDVGRGVGAVWFLMLFVAALTSTLSMYQPVVAFLRESLGVSRRAGTTLMVCMCTAGSFMVLYFTDGAVFWNTIDFWVGTFLILILAMVEVVCFGWVFGMERGWKEIHRGSRLRLPRLFRLVLKYIAPAYLLVILGAFSFANLPASLQQVRGQPMAVLAVLFTGLVLAALISCVAFGERRWGPVPRDSRESHLRPSE